MISLQVVPKFIKFAVVGPAASGELYQVRLASHPELYLLRKAISPLQVPLSAAAVV